MKDFSSVELWLLQLQTWDYMVSIFYPLVQRQEDLWGFPLLYMIRHFFNNGTVWSDLDKFSIILDSSVN